MEEHFRDWCRRYGYQEMRTPIFEETELFTRTVGEDTDIVTKQMYTFPDRGGRSLTLRAEGTAPVIRAYVEHKLYGQPSAFKVYYVAPIFRYERPQAGRYREHHQLGAEVIGPPGPETDAEVIALALDFLDVLGIKEANLEINSVGCEKCRPAYRDALKSALSPVLDQFCLDCQIRYDQNPLRTLDCKNTKCQELLEDVPGILDSLCEECQVHFDGLQRCLDDLKIAYQVNARIVRGLDYYTKTAFEIIHSGLGAQNTLVGGGRYDGLAEQCGGPPTPGVGFGAGIERILLVLQGQGWQPSKSAPLVYLAAVGKEAAQAVLPLLIELRRAGIAADSDFLGRSLKAQMKEADRLGSQTVLILGEEELAAGEVTLRDMETGEQTRVKRDQVVSRLNAEQEKES